MSKLRGSLSGSGESLRELRREAAGVTGVAAERCRHGSESAECVWSGAIWAESAESIRTGASESIWRLSRGAGYGMAPGLGMGWYKFVIYFQLFASALINGIAGIVALTGAHYEGEADLVYTFIPSLSTVDKLYGIVLIALAVFAIIVRFQLAQFKKTGPKFYLLLLLISGIASLIYLIAAGAIVSDFGIEIEYSSQISQLIVSAALLVANYIYFQKRSNLFVN